MPVPTLNVWPAMPRRREIGRLEARVGHRKAPEKREKEPSRAAVANSTCSRCWLAQSSSLGPAREVRVCRMRGGPVDVGLQRLRRLHRRQRGERHSANTHRTALTSPKPPASQAPNGAGGRGLCYPSVRQCNLARLSAASHGAPRPRWRWRTWRMRRCAHRGSRTRRTRWRQALWCTAPT